MVTPGQVELEMRGDDMHRFLADGLIGAAGPSQSGRGIWEAMVSDLQWEILQPILIRSRVPFKAADPVGARWSNSMARTGRTENKYASNGFADEDRAVAALEGLRGLRHRREH